MLIGLEQRILVMCSCLLEYAVFVFSDDLDSSDTVILGEMDNIEHYLDAGKI